jgi:6-phosphofructokinase 1
MRIGVLTSGGDAPGMNAALRAVVRRARTLGVRVTAIEDGYAGLLKGPAAFRPMDTADVYHILPVGGTVLGTARSATFREPEGRRRATLHLVQHGIDRLVVIGGDGSLSGAMALRGEWSSHLRDLVAAGDLDAEQAAACPALRLIGLVGSIDNDLCGTDSTIGVDTALRRCVDAIDALGSTARSHHRTFVVEVMGRQCGYLAAASALCTDADAVLLPEDPPLDWRAEVVAALVRGREAGRRRGIVVLAEGAADRTGRKITADEVRSVVEAGAGLETRVTVLGHVQRGGAPSALDRVLPTALGERAVDELLGAGPDDPPYIVGTRGDSTILLPLEETVRATRAVGDHIRAGEFALALSARGEELASFLHIHRQHVRPGRGGLLVAHVGAPAPGMNAALATIARLGHRAGWTVWAAQEGLRGVSEGKLRELLPSDVDGIVAQASTILGTNRTVPDDTSRRAQTATLRSADVRAAVLIGGFEALEAAEGLAADGISVVVLPATISNNVPGTDRSIGADTALNEVCGAVDRLKLSAIGARDRVFVVEVMGRRCGWLARTAGVGTGAEIVYTHEDGVDLVRIQRDLAGLRATFDSGRQVGIALVADGASTAWDAATLARILEAEAHGRFDTRVCVLGHTQQGATPSPRDRLTAIRTAAAALDHLAEEDAPSGVMGVRAGGVHFTPLVNVWADADRVNRRPRSLR